jgi:hypothetical protein
MLGARRAASAFFGKPSIASKRFGCASAALSVDFSFAEKILIQLHAYFPPSFFVIFAIFAVK